MQNVVLVIHLILALLLIGAVLLQRSEGGALGMGGGGNVMSGRGAATALQKVTWGLGAAFVATSLTLAVMASREAQDEGLFDRGAQTETPASTPGAPPAPPLGAELPPLPPAEADAPTGAPASASDEPAPTLD